MPKNLIQRMQGGGPAIRLEQYVPGQHFEKALGDVVEYHKFNKELEEEKRQFDKQADLEGDRLSIMSDTADSTARYQQGQLRLKDEELKRADFREFGSSLNPDAMVAYTVANDMPADTVGYAKNLKVNWNQFNDEYKTIRQRPGVTAEEWKTFKDKHRNNLSMFKDFAPNIGAEIENYHQGSMNKTLLSTMAGSEDFKKNMARLGINTGTWATMKPEDATYYLKNLPTWIGAGLESQKLSHEDKKMTATMISKAMEYLSAQYQSSAEYNPEDAQQIQNNFIELMETQLKDVEGLELSKKDDTLDDLQLDLLPEDIADITKRTGAITIGTGDAQTEVPKVFDADSKYRVEITDASGIKSTKTVKGSNAASIQRRKGWDITKADKIIKPLKMGFPQLDKGAVVKDIKSGKTLTYVGYDLPHKTSTIYDETGKKVKPSSYLYTPAGGLKVLFFKDEEGKHVIYSPRDIEKLTFIEPPAKQQAPEEEPIVVEETGEETGGGLNLNLLEGAKAGTMPDADSLNQAIAGTAKDSIDLFLQEDSLRQELEENE